MVDRLYNGGSCTLQVEALLSRSVASEPRISIIGAGLRPEHLTEEAKIRLAKAHRVYYSQYGHEAAVKLHSVNLAAEWINLEEDEYRLGMRRSGMYKRMAVKILRAAETHFPVAVLQPGSAIVIDTVTQIVLRKASSRGWRVEVMPGISSIEALLCKMGFDVAQGLQVVLAQDLVLRRVALSPKMATVIMQPGYYDTRFYAGDPISRPQRFSCLADELARSYPLDTPLALVLLPIASIGTATVVWCCLEHFPQFHRYICPFHTIFIPPPVRQERIDAAFQARIESWEQLLPNVQTDHKGDLLQTSPEEWFYDPTTVLPEHLRNESDMLAAEWESRRSHNG